MIHVSEIIFCLFFFLLNYKPFFYVLKNNNYIQELYHIYKTIINLGFLIEFLAPAKRRFLIFLRF